MKKPSVFIGSSNEGLDAARKVMVQLSDVADVTLWTDGVFPPTQGFLQSLINALERFDFAVFVFTPDDRTYSRGNDENSPRDNVTFELGLFMGRLGPTRVFVVHSNEPLKILSDFSGVTMLKYDANRSDGNLSAALGVPCVPIRDVIRDLGSSLSHGLHQIQQTSDKLHSDVEQAVKILAKARAFETELFLKYQSRGILKETEIERLKKDVAELNRIVEKFERKSTYQS